MPLTRKAAALSLGLFAILSAATIAQNPRQGQVEPLVIEKATVTWFQKSDVSALVEGVIDKMELRVGKEVGPPVNGKGPIIGYLHKTKADLAVEEARIQAQGEGAVLKARAQKELALTVVARNRRLQTRGDKMVSQEEVEKAEAELAAADASLIEARDTQRLAKAKLKSAEQAAEEHVIRAPFAGRILEEFKHEGESVRANEPVVQIGNLDTVRVWAYIPLEYAYRVSAGTEVIIQPRLGKVRGKQPIEQKQSRGVITAVDQSIQPIGEQAVRVYADLDNPNHELRPGLEATMTILLKPDGSTGLAGVPNQAELPALPRR